METFDVPRLLLIAQCSIIETKGLMGEIYHFLTAIEYHERFFYQTDLIKIPARKFPGNNGSFRNSR